MSFPNVTPENEETTMSSNKFKVGDTVLFRPRQYKNSVGTWDGPAQIVERIEVEPWAGPSWTIEYKEKTKIIHEFDYEIKSA